jgi:DNA-directed RNA polymerase specialized sigma54-like protein
VDMDLSFDFSQDMGQGMKVSPTLIAVNQILALSSQDLQITIKQEAEENPAFEIVEHQVCPICGDTLKGQSCGNCARLDPTRDQNPDNINYDDYSYQQDYAVGGTYNAATADEEFDPMTLVAAERTLGERLMGDLRAILDVRDIFIAEFLIGSLDERGFLSLDVPVIARQLGTDEGRVLHVLEGCSMWGRQGSAPATCASVCCCSSTIWSLSMICKSRNTSGSSSPSTSPSWASTSTAILPRSWALPAMPSATPATLSRPT